MSESVVEKEKKNPVDYMGLSWRDLNWVHLFNSLI